MIKVRRLAKRHATWHLLVWDPPTHAMHGQDSSHHTSYSIPHIHTLAPQVAAQQNHGNHTVHAVCGAEGEWKCGIEYERAGKRTNERTARRKRLAGPGYYGITVRFRPVCRKVARGVRCGSG